ncbi:Lrp/AsnC family transcriptional regulator [Pedobacter aquatilis]|uniref:Lrp/AsnC family transcriptional regulator n=1 Tax=Pedobacter aquatilis TaxID=351343 RepID=UPI002931C72A|nr:Lrp/AsnC family transcriptional regulator [Pedobacter aquatilis]
METYILDSTDYGILKYLQQDARMTFKELAHKLNRSQSPIQDRVKRLEKLGYIRSYVAIIDYSKMRDCLMAFIQVQLKDHSVNSLSEFQQGVCDFEEVMECSHTTGGYDFLLKIVTHNMQTYNHFLWHKLGTLQNVGAVNSSVVIAQAKNETAVPV